MVEVETEVRIERTKDVALIRSIITHPKVYPHVADDSAGSPESFDPSDAASHPNVYFLLAFAEELLGLFMVHQHNGVMYEVHTCLMPCAYGKNATKAGLALIAWVFENTQCEKLITFVPTGNNLAYNYAKRCGLKLEGIVTRSYKKNGVLMDQRLLGIEKCR